jgi:hypothetical protein
MASTDELAAPLHSLAGAETAPLSLTTYGGLKVACERALDEELAGRVQHVRAGLILDPHDYDARFRYWLERVARGGEVLAPGNPQASAQQIDARTLSAWVLTCAEARFTGPFNATGPARTACSAGHHPRHSDQRRPFPPGAGRDPDRAQGRPLFGNALLTARERRLRRVLPSPSTQGGRTGDQSRGQAREAKPSSTAANFAAVVVGSRRRSTVRHEARTVRKGGGVLRRWTT